MDQRDKESVRIADSDLNGAARAVRSSGRSTVGRTISWPSGAYGDVVRIYAFWNDHCDEIGYVTCSRGRLSCGSAGTCALRTTAFRASYRSHAASLAIGAEGCIVVAGKAVHGGPARGLLCRVVNKVIRVERVAKTNDAEQNRQETDGNEGEFDECGPGLPFPFGALRTPVRP